MASRVAVIEFENLKIWQFAKHGAKRNKMGWRT